MRLRACAWVMVLLLAIPVRARERLTLQVSPMVSLAPANLVVRAIVEADPANRSMAIIAESVDFYRSSQVELDGDRAPRTSIFEFRSLPSGTYQVRAILFGDNGHPRAQVGSQVSIVAGAGQ